MKALLFSMAALSLVFAVGCSTEPATDSGKQTLHTDAQSAIADFQTRDPGLQQVLANSAGYAIFPSVGKAAAVVGGAFGRGELYANSSRIGYCTMTQGDIGASLGGESWSELIIFKTPEALNNFKQSGFAFDAQASAALVNMGTAADAKYDHGIAVWVKSHGGLMVNAAVGGQKFAFEPME